MYSSNRDTVYYVNVEPKSPDPDLNQKLALIKEASGCNVQTISYRDILSNSYSMDSLNADNVLAWFISGSFAEWDDYPQNELEDLKSFFRIELADVPVLGVCAGHQIISMAYGAAVGHMSCFGAISKDNNCPEAFASEPKGWKTIEIKIIRGDPIFSGLTTKRFNFSHHDEVKFVPSQFTRLAETPDCNIQVLKHSNKLIYTTQFHPEVRLPGPGQTGGLELMKNFFRMADSR